MHLILSSPAVLLRGSYLPGSLCAREGDFILQGAGLCDGEVTRNGKAETYSMVLKQPFKDSSAWNFFANPLSYPSLSVSVQMEL